MDLGNGAEEIGAGNGGAGTEGESGGDREVAVVTTVVESGTSGAAVVLAAAVDLG
jgi:hypothetical protein